MVDARLAVGGRRSFEEYEFRASLTHGERLLESMVLLPSGENLIADSYQIKTFVLFECHIFFLILHSKRQR
jgi:hypothetical protein